MEGVSDFVKYVLPNIDNVPDLIRDHNGDVILKSVSLSKKIVLKQLMKQHQIFISDDNCEDVFLKFEKCIQVRPAAYICKVNKNFEHYVTFVGQNKNMYVLDPGILEGKISLNDSISEDMQGRLNKYQIEWVRCPQATISNSLCHAYTNAKVMIWAHRRFVDKDEFDKFSKMFSEIPLVANSNVNKMFAIIFNFNDDKEYSDDEMECQSRQRKIDKLIKNSVRHKKDIFAIKRKIEKKFWLDTREELYVEQMYIDQCEERFLTEVSKYFRNSPPDKVLDEVTIFLTKISKETVENFLQSIKPTFSTIDRFTFFCNCLELRSMTKSRRQGFLEKFRKLCTDFASDLIRLFKEEQHFVSLFEEYLLNCYHDGKTPFEEVFNNVFGNKKGICMKSLFTYLENTDDDEFLMLRTQSRKLLSFRSSNVQSLILRCWNRMIMSCSCCMSKSLLYGGTYTWSKILEDKLSSSMKEFKTSVSSYLNDGIIIFKGSYIKLDQIFKDAFLKSSKFHELHILASNVVIVNTNIVQPGKNLVIVSPRIQVNGRKYEWDLSGQNGKSNFGKSKAMDGVLPGDEGENGINGSNGVSGGNVLIVTDIFHNYENLSIKSNGGSGTDGQHGGDGKDGLDGNDGFGFPANDFKTLFPPCSFFRGKKVSHGINANINGFHITEDNTPNDNSKYIRGKCEKGNDVVFSYYSSNNVGRLLWSFIGNCQFRSAYCFVTGTDGTPGKKGGDGGCGGIAGKGAYAGKIEIKNFQGDPHSNITYKTENGSDGVNGNDGKGGKGGKNGKRGPDNAWQETIHSGETRYHNGNLVLMYTSRKTQEGVWCNKNNKYVVIESKKKPPETSCDSGKLRNKESVQAQEIILRQKAILDEQVLGIYQKIRVTNPFAEMNSNTDKIHTLTSNSENAFFATSHSLQKQGNFKQIQNPDSVPFLPLPTMFEANISYAELIAIPKSDVTKKSNDRVIEQSSIVGYCLDTLRNLAMKMEDFAVMWMKQEKTCLQQPTEIILRKMITTYIKESALEMKDNTSEETVDVYAEEKYEDFKLELNKMDPNNMQQQNLQIPLFGFQPSDTDGDIECEKIEETDSNQNCSSPNEVLKSNETSNNENKTNVNEINTSESNQNTISNIQFPDSIPNSFRTLISKLYYLGDNKNITNLVQIMVNSFEFEGCVISSTDFQWLITRILAESEFGIDDFIVAFSVSRQQYWLSQYLSLQIIDLFQLPLEEEIKLVRTLIQYESCDMVLLLSHELLDIYEVGELTHKDLVNILELSKDLKLTSNDIHYFKEIKISDWSSRLKTLCFLRRLPVKWTLEGQISEAVFCLQEIRDNYGTEVTDMFSNALVDVRNLDLKVLIGVLNSLRCRKWKLSRNLIQLVRTKPQEEWISYFSDLFNCDKERCLTELFQLISTDANSSYKEKEFEIMKDKANQSIQASIVCSKILTSSKTIQEYKKNDIDEWIEAFHKNAGDNPNQYLSKHSAEVFAVIYQGLFLVHQFHFRDTQRLAIMLFLCAENHGMLQQICTGEGKSLVIAAVAICKVLSGQNVDIITSSSVLAIRDSDVNKQFFTLFGISVGHNCSDNQNDRKATYVNCSVVYGEVGSFQRDQLMNDFYNEDIGIGSRKKGTVLVDEVDSMLLDKGQNVLYLSHNIPGFDALECVYVGIWSFVHSDKLTGKEEDIQLVEEAMKNVMYPWLRKSDIETILNIHNKRHIPVNHVWSLLIDNHVISENGEILVSQDKMQMSLLSPTEIPMNILQSLFCEIENIRRKGTDIKVPIFLKDFVNLHLREWIESAFKAKFMDQNDHYIIDIDRSETNYSSAPNIVIMDKDTGVEQYHSQWSNGLHQFLQLKHACRLTFESLKAVFMSNVTFFQSYQGQLCGLTGTLGSAMERDLLKSLYEVDYITIPSFRQSKFSELETKICANEETLLEEIFDTVSYKVNVENRPALIVCESIQFVEKVEQMFRSKQNGKQEKVYVYKRGYEPLTLGQSEEIDHACILISTNLAGRGTDLKISERINEIGCLHVCLTYLPSNRRIEEQAFGRSARKGQNGSGQTIFLASNKYLKDQANTFEILIKIKTQRNLEEDSHICKINKHYTDVIQVEEDLLSKFKRKYRWLEQKLKEREKRSRKEKNDEIDIWQQNFLHEWALTLPNH